MTAGSIAIHLMIFCFIDKYIFYYIVELYDSLNIVLLLRDTAVFCLVQMLLEMLMFCTKPKFHVGLIFTICIVV